MIGPSVSKHVRNSKCATGSKIKIATLTSHLMKYVLIVISYVFHIFTGNLYSVINTETTEKNTEGTKAKIGPKTADKRLVKNTL